MMKSCRRNRNQLAVNWKKSFTGWAFMLLAACLVLSANEHATAADSGAPLFTKLRGKISGFVGVFADGRAQIIKIDIFDAAGPNKFIVTARRGKRIVRIAWMITDKNGQSTVTLHSAKTPFPYLQAGDLIEVWHANEEVVASGVLTIPK